MGENRPSRVKADITINLTVNDAVKREWEGVCVCIIVCYTCIRINHHFCYCLLLSSAHVCEI